MSLFANRFVGIELTAALFASGILLPALGASAEPANPVESSCFFGAIAHAGAADEAPIAAATIYIAFVEPDGALVSQGTGFAVQGSTGAAAGPRILTAAHVVQRGGLAGETLPLIAFFSDGAPIGPLRVVAAGTASQDMIGEFDVVADDLAVVEIQSFADAQAKARYVRLEGLALAAGHAIMVGETSEPAGAFWGFSGAAAIDRAGRVRGVLTGAAFRGRVSLESGSIQASNAAGFPVARPTVLPSHSLVVVEPVRAPEILRVLRSASPLAAAVEPVAVVLAGFPMSSCVATTTILHDVASPEAASLLARWREIGQVGAWILPPPLDRTKLRLGSVRGEK